MSKNLELAIVHRLPGRIRLRLSHPPNQAGSLADHIQNHVGITSVRYTDVTRNILIEFDQNEITPQEIVIRAGLSLSMDYEMSPVRIRIRKKNEKLGNLSALAFAILALNHAIELFTTGIKHSRAFQMISGATTLAAVVDHAAQDIKDKGYFHPEVFSVYYLLLSFLRGNMLKGSTITWFLTFGRHLLEMPPGMILLKTEKADPSCDIHGCEYEVTVSNERESNRLLRMFHTVPNMLFKYYKEMDFSLLLEDTFMTKMEQVANAHDDIMEGLENVNQGFHIRVETQS